MNLTMQQQDKEVTTSKLAVKIECLDPAPLRVHPLKRGMRSAECGADGAGQVGWNGFVDAVQAAGPEGIPPIYVTPEGLIMDGERRWKAARQLQWPTIGCVVRPEWEAALVIVESLMGQRSLTKGAKVYLALPLMPEYTKAAESRRLVCLKKGVKILQKANDLPLPDSIRSRHERTAAARLSDYLGTSEGTVEQAIRIRKFFELTALAEHKFDFQDGVQRTLREHFEPLMLDPEHPMGLGEVLKGIGWFVDENGTPLLHAPPERNSHLHYFTCAWEGWAKQSAHWADFDAGEREQAMEIVDEAARAVPEEVLVMTAKKFKDEVKRRKKAESRKKG
jgi:hypothetical protein